MFDFLVYVGMDTGCADAAFFVVSACYSCKYMLRMLNQRLTYYCLPHTPHMFLCLPARLCFVPSHRWHPP